MMNKATDCSLLTTGALQMNTIYTRQGTLTDIPKKDHDGNSYSSDRNWSLIRPSSSHSINRTMNASPLNTPRDNSAMPRGTPEREYSKQSREDLTSQWGTSVATEKQRRVEAARSLVALSLLGSTNQ